MISRSINSAIINRVDWIFKSRESIKKLELEKNVISSKISELRVEVIDKLGSLKHDMGSSNNLNAKIGEKYYALSKSALGVDINEFFIEVKE